MSDSSLSRRSITSLFSTTSALIFIAVLVFNALVIYELMRKQQTINTSAAAISLSEQLFALIRSNGYERGRVHVILNYQGERADAKIAEFESFTQEHRQLGSELMHKIQDKLAQNTFRFNPATADTLASMELQSDSLRQAYLQQFDLPFVDRDMAIGTRWFSHMSQQIRLTNQLIYEIKEGNEIAPALRPHLNMLMLLGQLRDHSGPAVSYFKAATFSPDSLTMARIDELNLRRSLVQQFIRALVIDARFHLPAEIVEKIEAFELFYQTNIIAITTLEKTNTQVDMGRISVSPAYLQNGVKALEQLQSISDSIVNFSKIHLEQEKRDIQIALISSAVISLIALVSILFNIFLIYRRILQRITDSAKIMSQLSSGQVDILVPAPVIDDEIGDLEQGLQLFQHNLLALHENNEKLERLSQLDSMTELLNHKAILQRLHETHQYAKRYDMQYSVLMIDIDWFKTVNDTHGHQTGDQVLIQLAQLLRQQLRVTDLLGRYGGEEFLVVLVNTGLDAAVELAKKLRQWVESESFSDHLLSLTVSIGVANLSHHADENEVVAKADQQLYHAKNLGRNQVSYCQSDD